MTSLSALPNSSTELHRVIENRYEKVVSSVADLVDLIKLRIFSCGRSVIKSPVVEIYWISHKH